jgi:hypothetical protein
LQAFTEGLEHDPIVSPAGRKVWASGTNPRSSLEVVLVARESGLEHGRFGF